jgi:hypothetical protein
MEGRVHLNGGATIDLLKSRAQRALRLRPDFLVIGTQKAGTTSLHRYLAQHPRLVPAAGPKELHFFNLRYDRGLGWYLGHFPPRFLRGGQLYFEATPDYLVQEVVPERIRRNLPRVRLIAVLREPAERAYSAWRMWHHFAEARPEEAAKADRRSFASAIDAELSHPDGSADAHYHYVAMGRYAEQLARYRALFRADEMLVLDHAEMERDLPVFLGRICDFLGVERFPPGTAAGLGRERHWVGPARAETAEVRATLERLRAYYRPHNERLFDLLGERWDWPRPRARDLADPPGQMRAPRS